MSGQTKPGHTTGTRLSHDCHKTVTRLSHYCHKTVTRLSHDCHKTVTRLSQDCHTTVSRLSQDCHRLKVIQSEAKKGSTDTKEMRHLVVKQLVTFPPLSDSENGVAPFTPPSPQYSVPNYTLSLLPAGHSLFFFFSLFTNIESSILNLL